MNTAWRIVRGGADLAASWSALRRELWPQEDPARHAGDVRQILGRADTAVGFLAVEFRDGDVQPDGAIGARALGFAEATLRGDYVNGCHSSPVGFLEGWFVVPDARGRGIGRALVAAVEDWARQRGCTEMASDCLLDNVDAHRAHRACGFDEAERVVYFHKRLAP